jgi:nucleoside-diphosphate-sugar epimerase
VSGRTLLLLGGSGFFGKSVLDAFARGLLAEWDVARVIALARDTGRLRRECPELVGPRVDLVDADIATATTLPDADVVIHAACSADAARYRDDPEGERRNILSGVDRFCDLAPMLGAAKIVYCSSGAVYGAQPAEVAALDEDRVPAPATGLVDYKRAYAEAKRAAEVRIAMLGGAGLNVAVARPFAFVGAYLPRDRHFAIGSFLADGVAGRAVKVAARQAVWRSWMHADDLVRWLLTIADAASPACPIYNVGSDEALLVEDAARIVATRFGTSALVPERTSAVVDRYVPGIAKARGQLGLTLAHDLASAVDDVAARLAEPCR